MDHHGPHTPHHHHSHHHLHHHYQQQQHQLFQPPMIAQNPPYPTTTTTTTTTTNNNNLPLPPNPSPLFHTHFPFNPTNRNPSVALPTHDGSGSGSGSGELGVDHHSMKKRGRPRKYSPTDNAAAGGGGDGGIALGLSPSSADGGGPEHRKHRGRPAGSGKKQLDALGNCGVGFTPHVILVNAGEDIASKIIAFSKDGPRTVCVMSANGSICNASLRQPGNVGGIVNYEGRYEIISLSGSFLFSEDGGNVRTNGLSVSMAGSDGRVLGGGVAGMLLAASTVQIIVGSFIAGGKKIKSMPTVPNSHMLSFSSPPDVGSPPSQGASSEGSEENASNHNDRNTGAYNNSNHPMHHHNMQMYTHMGWSNSGSKMPNHQM